MKIWCFRLVYVSSVLGVYLCLVFQACVCVWCFRLVYALGVGTSVNQAELDIIGDATQRVDDFAALNSTIENILTAIQTVC